jgi:hypothetical protein
MIGHQAHANLGHRKRQRIQPGHRAIAGFHSAVEQQLAMNGLQLLGRDAVDAGTFRGGFAVSEEGKDVLADFPVQLGFLPDRIADFLLEPLVKLHQIRAGVPGGQIESAGQRLAVGFLEFVGRDQPRGLLRQGMGRAFRNGVVRLHHESPAYRNITSYSTCKSSSCGPEFKPRITRIKRIG